MSLTSRKTKSYSTLTDVDAINTFLLLAVHRFRAAQILPLSSRRGKLYIYGTDKQGTKREGSKPFLSGPNGSPFAVAVAPKAWTLFGEGLLGQDRGTNFLSATLPQNYPFSPRSVARNNLITKT